MLSAPPVHGADSSSRTSCSLVERSLPRPRLLPPDGWTSVLRVECSSHDDTPFRIEAATGLTLDDGAQFRRELVGRDHLEPQSRVERHVPRYVAEGRQRDRLIPLARRPIADSL